MHTDPIADLLTRIRNTANANKGSCVIPYSKIKENILNILVEKQIVKKFEVTTDEKFKELFVTLNEGQSINLKRVSKPGQRIYVKKHELKTLRSGIGVRIISTSKGLMTIEDARKQNLGGELLCEAY